MLLLYHDHHKIEASGRTRTDEYEFTKLVLWLLRHRGKMASTAGIAPATSTFARWRSDLTELRGPSKCKMKNAKWRLQNAPARRPGSSFCTPHSSLCIESVRDRTCTD